MSRCCSQCGTNGHNSRTCGNGGGGGGGDGESVSEFMLFGVRVKVDPMRKSVSMNNLSDYDPLPLPLPLPVPDPISLKNSQEDVNNESAAKPSPALSAAGYASADDALPPNTHRSTAAARERKRGVPWTEEEHKLFLLGLQKAGKGDWRGISRNFVKTRTPTQVASHAQKYYLRKSNLNRRRRRSSLFDITTADSVTDMPMEEGKGKTQQDETTKAARPATSLRPHKNPSINGFAVAQFPVTVGPVFVPVQVQNPLSNMTVCQADNFNNRSALLVRSVPVPVIPVPNSAAASAVLNLNHRAVPEPLPLSLRLSLSSDQSQSSTRHSAFQVKSSFNSGDSIITVA